MNKKCYVLILIIIAAFIFSCSGCEKRKTELTSIIPQDAQNVVLIPSAGSLVGGIMQFFKLFENGVAFEALKKEIDLASQKLGINLLDKKSIIEAGFDPDGSIAVVSVVVVSDGKQQNANILIMPYSDRSKAENTLNRLSREKEKTEIFKTKSYMDAKIVTAIRQGPKGEKPVLMYAFYKGFVIYGLPERAEAAIRKIVDTKELNSLSKNTSFTALRNKIRGGQIYFFINSGKNIETPGFMLNREMKQMITSVRENFNGMMLAADISAKGINLSSFTGLSQKSVENIRKYFIKTPTEDIEKLMYIVPEDPFFLAKLSLNFESIYKLLKEENPYQMMIINKRIFGPMMKYMEVDVEKDILPLIKGSLVYSVSLSEQSDINGAIQSGFKGEAFNKLFNVYYSMSLTDKKLSDELLARFKNSIKEKGQPLDEIKVKDIDITSSRFGAAYNSYWFTDEGNFYAFYSGEKPESVFRKPPEKGKKPLYKIEQDIYQIVTNPSSQLLYVSFSPLKRVADRIDEKNLDSVASTGIYKFTFMLIKELLGKLDNMAVYMIPESEGIILNLGINVRSK
ncbi:MAG: DUF3352 domain-containing protein [Deltaproteobacteria bacterium]|nr:DUF3352 domain-containing protein [Deltaproteobacteria bacterium]